MYAAHHKIDNVIATIDLNGQQIDGPTEKVMDLKDVKAKWQAFGWDVIESEGNDMKSVINAMNLAKSLSGKGKPVINLMKTEMGAGVDFMMGSHKWHGVAPNDEQLANALSQLEETLGDY
jgi:transketolase